MTQYLKAINSFIVMLSAIKDVSETISELIEDDDHDELPSRVKSKVAALKQSQVANVPEQPDVQPHGIYTEKQPIAAPASAASEHVPTAPKHTLTADYMQKELTQAAEKLNGVSGIMEDIQSLGGASLGEVQNHWPDLLQLVEKRLS